MKLTALRFQTGGGVSEIPGLPSGNEKRRPRVAYYRIAHGQVLTRDSGKTTDIVLTINTLGWHFGDFASILGPFFPCGYEAAEFTRRLTAPVVKDDSAVWDYPGSRELFKYVPGCRN